MTTHLRAAGARFGSLQMLLRSSTCLSHLSILLVNALSKHLPACYLSPLTSPKQPMIHNPAHPVPRRSYPSRRERTRMRIRCRWNRGIGFLMCSSWFMLPCTHPCHDPCLRSSMFNARLSLYYYRDISSRCQHSPWLNGEQLIRERKCP